VDRSTRFYAVFSSSLGLGRVGIPVNRTLPKHAQLNLIVHISTSIVIKLAYDQEHLWT